MIKSIMASELQIQFLVEMYGGAQAIRDVRTRTGRRKGRKRGAEKGEKEKDRI